MKILWKNKANPYVRMLLIQCYSGWRPNEVCKIKLADIDLKNQVFVSGSKTEAGKNRQVPIHKNILDFVTEQYNYSLSAGSEYLFPGYGHDNKIKPNEHITYGSYLRRFNMFKEKLGLSEEHHLHDGRTHFVTLAKKYELDECAIKYIVGHSIKDITERVYTKRTIDWLKEEMSKIQ